MALLFSSGLFGQKALTANIYKSIGVATNSEFATFDANYGAQMEYQFVWKEMKWITGIDLRVIDWGNQVGMFLGQNKNLYQKEKWNVSLDYKLQANVPLFYDQFLLGYGASSNMYINVRVYKSIQCRIGAGLRFDSLPSYSKYSPISSTFELPITVSLKKNFGKGKSE